MYSGFNYTKLIKLTLNFSLIPKPSPKPNLSLYLNYKSNSNLKPTTKPNPNPYLAPKSNANPDLTHKHNP